MRMVLVMDCNEYQESDKSLKPNFLKSNTMTYTTSIVLRLSTMSLRRLGVLMNNELVSIAQVLAQRVNDNKPTQLADMVDSKEGKRQLNYEIMFQLLMGECEKHILENKATLLLMSLKTTS
jgi:hypothetical protein